VVSFYKKVVDFVFFDFNYYYYSFWVYFSFSSFPQIFAKMRIGLHSPQRFESGREVEKSEVELVLGEET
jgi:hypothetical protein